MIRLCWAGKVVSRGVCAGALSLLVALVAHARDDAHAGDEESLAPSDVDPPLISVLQAGPGASRGLIFIAPKGAEAVAQGPEIVDDEGRPVWFLPLPVGAQATDFRVQSYRGEPVLTWLQREVVDEVAHTKGYIVDRSYRVVETVEAGNGFVVDGHDFRITRGNTALIPIYHRVPYDLTSVGGRADGVVIEGIVQEVEIGSGRVLFEWHSLDHVGIDESYSTLRTVNNPAYDYFHLNSVSLDKDGNLLLSARHTSAIYKISRRTGEVIWRMGGKRSDFALEADAVFGWQHDAIAIDRSTIRLFDNHTSRADDTVVSRVLWLQRDRATQTVSLLRSVQHPDGVMANSQGGAQGLPNGHTFVGWGPTGRFSEFDAEGQLVFDARAPAGYHTYRAYRSPWRARPDTSPTATAQRNDDGTITVHAIWNGATEVSDWYVVGGKRRCGHWPLAHADWNGLDTTLTLDADVDQVAVVARDARGRWLGRSASVPVDAAP
jgi:hypothetical protein